MRLAGRRVAVALAAALPGLASASAEAGWRVVGPGIAVADAEEGRAALAVECEGGLALAAYGLSEAIPAPAALLLEVDGRRFALTAVPGGRRVALAEAETGAGGAVSPALREALETGRRAELSGRPLASLPPEALRFALRGGRAAFASVERACG